MGTAGPPEADGEAWRRGPAASRCSGAVWAEGLCEPRASPSARGAASGAAAGGICSELIIKPKNVSQEELLDITDQLNMDPRVSGILVQLPLPDHVDERTICNGIAPEKDVDGFHIINIGRLCLDQHSLIPATASAVWEIIKRAGDATVTIAHRYTPREQLKAHTQLADIIIVAAGIPRLITADMVREGAAVIDVGINYIQDPVTGKTKLVGDVDFEGGPEKELEQLQNMALGVLIAVCLLFKAMKAALSEEAEVIPPSTAQQSNWTFNNTEADYIEEPVALKFSHPCLEDHNSYCINGACAFHHELKQAICRCFTGYTGQRCEHLTLTSYAVDSYEKYIAIGIGVGLLISAFLAVFYCYIRKRCINLKSPYIICSGGSPL